MYTERAAWPRTFALVFQEQPRNRFRECFARGGCEPSVWVCHNLRRDRTPSMTAEKKPRANKGAPQETRGNVVTSGNKGPKGPLPSILRQQVLNTSAWSLTPDAPWTPTIEEATRLDEAHSMGDAQLEYFRLLVTCHFLTVATFVPTDVDPHIRHHAWQALRSEEALNARLDIVEEIAAWDASRVSARVVTVPNHDEPAAALVVSGHEGEWFSIWAGALGRALELGFEKTIDRIVATIDGVLEREARAMSLALGQRKARTGTEVVLNLVTTLAHNTGDLSRVVDQWPIKTQQAQSLAARYLRLGHEKSSQWGNVFALAGHINKAMTADENHRFLALRKVKSLRSSRELILPLGPCFDEWGKTLAACRTLDAQARGEILAVILDAHERAPSQQGYLRALHGIHNASPGGLERIAAALPARQRKALSTPAIREALSTPADRFLARLDNRLTQVIGEYR